MSIDKSLKSRNKLVRPRNVYTKVERIAILQEQGRWDSSMSVFGIPKVKIPKAKRKTKGEKRAQEKAEAEKDKAK